MTRYYLDTEFNDDGHTIELISAGIICEDGRELYCVSDDFDPDLCNDWVKQNVLPQLPGEQLWMPRRMIADRIRAFIVPAPEIEIWAYYGDYDWVAICQLFGSMMMLPEHFPQLCLDLKQLALSIGYKDSLKTLLPMDDGEHDALEDARWNRDVHRMLECIQESRAGAAAR